LDVLLQELTGQDEPVAPTRQWTLDEDESSAIKTPEDAPRTAARVPKI